MKTLKLPITNVYAKGDYCVTFHIGSENIPVNLILDTGSSTLVLKEDSYLAAKDNNLVATAMAQEVNYGIGGWNGPVVHSNISITDHNQKSLTLKNSTFALVSNKEQYATFGKADGFVGLAYHHLNKGFNLTDYLVEQKVAPAHTYPWPFQSDSTPNSNNLKDFKHFLWQYPEHDITPYFTDLALHNLSANKFSFYSKRSAIHMNKHSSANTNIDALRRDPLNQGWLIFGGGEEQTDLYNGDFKQIKIEHDVYYNVELISVQVGDKAPITAAPLKQEQVKNYLTNAIIDTGAGGIILTSNIYQQMIEDLISLNPTFKTLLSPFTDFAYQEVGIDNSQLSLEQWPNITFTFVSNTINHQKQMVQLICTPQNYWQVNTPQYGKACFRFLSQLPQWPNQSIIGLPLLNNYYVIFDRSVDKTGIIKFAEQK